jgi:hypothetical protein
MSELTLKPEAARRPPPADSRETGDRLIGVRTLDDAAALGAAGGNGHSAHAVRRRFSVTRLAQPIDDGSHPLRVY